jgi:hypothetical protein
MATLLPDELLGDVIAAGQADVLVVLPTHNNAQSAAAVVHAVLGAFSGPFVRERTVLLNLDAHSVDGTPDAIRGAGATPGELVSRPYALRTIHRITAPYHGVPGRGTALRMAFAVAELMHVRALVILDPSADDIAVEDVALWIRAVLTSGADYVKPALPRAPAEGPLISQVVRPLYRAACGVRLAEPIDTQLACSGRFAAKLIEAEFWTLPEAEVGPDAFLSVHAAISKVRLAQVATAATSHLGADRRPGVAEVFQQVVGASLVALARTNTSWASIIGSTAVPTEGHLPPPPSRPPRFDLAGFTQTFRTGLDALGPLLAGVLDGPLMEALQAGAGATPVSLNDPLWARTVLAFLAAAIGGVASAADLARMLEPLYLGRVASFVSDLAAGDGRDRLEALATTFEEQKPAFVAALQSREKDHGKRDTGELARSA